MNAGLSIDDRRGWHGYASLSRAATLGRRSRERWGYVASMAVMLGMAVSLAAGFSDGVGDTVFSDALLLVGLLSSSGLTSTALRAQRLFTGAVAPRGALRDWRRGWAEGQVLIGLVLFMLALGMWTWAGRGHGDLLLLPGAIVLVQALAAWGAFAFTGRSLRLGFLAVGVGLLVAAHAASVRAFVAPLAPAAVDVVLGAIGAAGLVVAWRRLRPDARVVVHPAAQGAWPAPVIRLMQRWTPLSSTLGRRWWGLWLSAGSNILLVASQSGSGIWASTSPWTRLSLVLWFTCMVMGTVSVQSVHWRVWLRPGGPRRDRLGRHMFLSTLQVYGLVLAPVLIVASAIAWLLGVTPVEIALHLLRNDHFFFEMLFSISLGVLIVGAFFGRWSQAVIAWVSGSMAFSAVALLSLTRERVPPGARVPAVDFVTAYDVALLVATLVCILLADRAWHRRNLDDVFRRRFEPPRGR